MPVPLILALAASTALAMPPTSKPFDQLRAVNATINSTVRYETDHDLYGRDELWTVARDAGDCEDIALRKREELLKLGWAPQDLRLVRVDIYDEIGHAVLEVRWPGEEPVILDNMFRQVIGWSTAEANGYFAGRIMRLKAPREITVRGRTVTTVGP